jgi:hypothetical protein
MCGLTPDERFAERLRLLGDLARIFGTDHVDLVVLNEASPLLAYETLRHGVLLYCADAQTRIEFQVRTLRAYEDTSLCVASSLKRWSPPQGRDFWQASIDEKSWQVESPWRSTTR